MPTSSAQLPLVLGMALTSRSPCCMLNILLSVAVIILAIYARAG
jgi:hypothetical protein